MRIFVNYDMPPAPPAVIKFANDNGYDYVECDEVPATIECNVFKVYSKSDETDFGGVKKRIFSLVYIICEDGQPRFATKDEIPNLLQRHW